MNYIDLVGCLRLYACDRLGKKITGELRFRAKLYSLVYNETAGEICEAAWRWGLSFVPGNLMCASSISVMLHALSLCVFSAQPHCDFVSYSYSSTGRYGHNLSLNQVT